MYEQYFECFTYVQKDGHDECAIKLTVPPFDGVVLVLGTRLQIIETGISEESIRFDYVIEEVPPSCKADLKANKELENLLGAILLGILEHHCSKDQSPENTSERVDDNRSI
jgi:hypothetical protein